MRFLLSFALLFSFLFLANAQNTNRQTGPIIHDFGPTFSVENPDFITDTTKVYKVVFDIHGTPDDPTKINPMLNTLARFLNMHAQAGVPLENMKVAGVFHNKATHDILEDEGYEAKYGVKNPNLALLTALDKAGANLYICGQSIGARGVDRTQIHDSVGVALSAMTVILSLQSDDYQLIKF
ncbi:MAG: DsrE family protein [Saprospiraceae bacterium]